jgi:hypothetical protein
MKSWAPTTLISGKETAPESAAASRRHLLRRYHVVKGLQLEIDRQLTELDNFTDTTTYRQGPEIAAGKREKNGTARRPSSLVNEGRFP